ncbi:unnamed protein product [Pedinophyceae sp. YPF-701]|nr:unnamed protein product [Pedinophyceae sp. YPF-701]
MPPKKEAMDLGANLSDPRIQQALIALTQEKLNSLVGKPVHLEEMSEAVKARVEELETLQEEYDNIHEKYVEEERALRAKYQALYEPVYDKRRAVVLGEEAQGDERGVPRFWVTVLQICPETAELVQEKDVPALEALRDIRVVDPLEDGEEGFKLVFEFGPNEYFENEKIEKTYLMAEDDAGMLRSSTATPIKWKEGKDLTVKIVKKKPKKGGKNAKPVMKQEDAESFFQFFKPPKIPDDEDELDEEEMTELTERLETDYAVGEMLKEQLVPDAVRWYTGEALDLDEDDEEYDDDEDGEGDGQDDDDDDDEDEDGEGEGGQGEGEAAPDCKQQ